MLIWVLPIDEVIKYIFDGKMANYGQKSKASKQTKSQNTATKPEGGWGKQLTEWSSDVIITDNCLLYTSDAADER